MKTPIIFAETVTSKTDNACLFRSGQKYTLLWRLRSRLTKLPTCNNKKWVKPYITTPFLEILYGKYVHINGTGYMLDKQVKKANNDKLYE